MPPAVQRLTVDLAQYPDLVVIYLGMRMSAWRGLRTIMGLGPQIDRAGAEWPEGLLHYDNGIIFSLKPLHVGMRWYWKDLASMDAWTRSEPHRKWWKDYLRDAGGTEFWHETYFMRGGMEAVYCEVTGRKFGFLGFAPTVAPRGSTLAPHRQRLGVQEPGKHAELPH